MASAARAATRSLLAAAPGSLPPDRWLTLSLLIAVGFTAWPQPHDASLSFFVLVIALVASLRFRLGVVALVALFAVGVDLRLAEFGEVHSDVDEAIRGAIQIARSGGNPYLVEGDEAASGSPIFPYGPLALLWYAVLGDPRLQEGLVSVAMLALLAARGRPMGLALWATAPLAVQLAADGSNDHSMAVLLLTGLVVLERMPRAGAVVIGVAAGFKIYALAWLPPLFVWAGLQAAVAAVVATLAVWLPAAVLWGPTNILRSFQAADAVHRIPYYSLGQLLRIHAPGEPLPREALNMFRLVAGTVTALVLAPFARSHARVVVCGMLIYVVTLYAGFWSTPAYLIPLLLVLCWYLDVWLGPRDTESSEDPTRVRWPRDPVGALTRAVDRRWPRVDAARIGDS